MSATFEDIVIDAEFAALIPPLSVEERQQHAEHLRYWACVPSMTRSASQALSQIAAELDLVVAWAREHQPADTRERVEPYYQPRTPDRSSD